MKVLHVLDHSLPVASGYSYRSRSIVTFEKRLGLSPVVLTSPRPDRRHSSSRRGYRKEPVAPQASRRHVAYSAQSLVRAHRVI